MNAKTIIHLWSRVSKPLNNRPGTWLQLLEVAAAGREGVQRLAIPGAPHALMAKRWSVAGLVTVTTDPSNGKGGGVGGRGRQRLHITEKGLRFLGLTAQTNNARETELAACLAWMVAQLEGDSGTGASHWEQLPEFIQARKLVR